MSKALTAKCVTCRKLQKKPLDQLMEQIPSLRVASGFPPFSNTAMDMFGPVHIKLNRKTLKEAQVVIFTCMTMRAVHLELVTDKNFLMAFRRFTCLRGHPRVCWSDWNEFRGRARISERDRSRLGCHQDKRNSLRRFQL